MIVTAYIDESGTHGGEFVIVGGVVSTVAKWNDFDRLWRKLLARHGVPYFHGVEFRNRRGVFAKFNPASGVHLIERINALIQRRAACGFSIRLDRADYREAWIAGPPIKGVQLDSQYGVCFRFILALLPDLLSRSFGRDDLVVNIIMESGDKSIGAGDAQRVLAQIKREVPEIGRHLGTLTIGDKRRHPGLQAADAIAYNAFREEGSVAGPDLAEFVDQGTLRDAKDIVDAKCPIFRCHATPEVLRSMRQGLEDWKAARREFGARTPRLATPKHEPA
jgi:hypothetical protein